MKKLIRLLFILLVLYFGIELSFVNLNKGHNLEYKIKKGKHTFLIKEIYTQKRRNEINNYYFEIKLNNNTFNYQTYKNYKRANYIIKDIDYFESDKYKCIYIKDKNNEQLSDIICLNNNIQYYYNDIKGKDEKIDNYVKKLKYNGYKDNLNRKIDADPVTLYIDNIIDNHYISLQNYKGLYLINKKDNIKNISLFKDDIYKNEGSITADKYYLTFDYNQEYKFHEMYLINLKNGKKSKIISNDDISLDSYIQGSVNKEIYLFDKSEKIQYRINLKNKTVTQSGNKEKGINIYKNNKYEIGSAYDSEKEKVTFNIYSYSKTFMDKEYARVDKVGNKLSGYYYLYLKNDNKYDVYRVSVQNKKILTYLFTTDDLNNIYYYKDYVYYKDNLNIKYYQNEIGKKTLLKNTEFEFNKSLKFGLYVN